MKLTHKLFHRMINRSCMLQGYSLIYTGMAKYLDVPVLLLTLGRIYWYVYGYMKAGWWDQYFFSSMMLVV